MISDLTQNECRRLKSPKYQQLWEKRFAELEDFKRRFGHCFVPVEWAENQPLGRWVASQRVGKRAGWLGWERMRRLEGIDFPWTGTNKSHPRRAVFWEARFKELLDWKARHGHFRVPQTNDSRLADWIDQQRSAQWEHRLTADRLERLNAIGFPWEPDDPLWEQRFAQLQAIQEERKGGYFTPGWPEDALLEEWIQAQRVSRHRGQLSQERISRLDKIGFRWKTNRRRGQNAEAHWEIMFEALQEFHRQHGHFRVSEDPPLRPGLRRWVLRQRGNRKRGTLRKERFEHLSEAGFPWGLQEEPRWEMRYAELAAYKAQHGHCNVPSHWRQNRKLGSWVMNQRLAKRLGRGRPDHIQKLNELGFEWRS